MRATPLLAFVLSVALVAGAAAPPGGAAVRWGEHGHRMVGQAAAVALPPAMPEFFRKAAPQLSYLNPEPDRWRDRRERDIDPAMDGAHAPEHYVDMELVVRNGLSAPHRLAYAESLLTGGAKASTVGLLPYTTLELFQRLRVGFREWRAAPNAQLREWIEQRIINDAGILGHYVADGSNPHHTSQHHDRWVGDSEGGFAHRWRRNRDRWRLSRRRQGPESRT